MLSLQVTPVLAQRVSAAVANSGLSRSAWMREAIEAKLDGYRIDDALTIPVAVTVGTYPTGQYVRRMATGEIPPTP
jgi:hypothetical protein